MSFRRAVSLCALLLLPLTLVIGTDRARGGDEAPFVSSGDGVRDAIALEARAFVPPEQPQTVLAAPSAAVRAPVAESPAVALPAQPQPVVSPEASQPAPPVAAETFEPAPLSAFAAPAAPLLDGNQMVVFYGTPLASGLGVLGLYEPEEAAQRVQAQTRIYDDLNGDRGAIGAFDLIYALAQDEPTDNGLYIRYLEDDVVWRYIALAEEYELQVILDLQIGRGNIADEVRKIERFLLHPRVHVAIDPEYAVGPDGAPIETPGSMSGHDINEVQDYLADLVVRHGLPQKLAVIHQYMDETIVDGEATRDVAEVDLVLNMDAFGDDKEKRKKYRKFSSRKYAEKDSFNIFLKQDDRVLSEAEVLDLSPEPDVVFYQ